jgi:hypothetical protein
MITGIFALLISIGCFWFSFKFIKTYAKVKSWTKTEATVLSKSVSMHEKYSTRNTPFAVKVEYQYVFNNTPYTNNTVSLAELLGGQVNYMEKSANKIIDGIKDKTPIFVNPQNPQQSVIFCDGLGLYIIVIFIGFIAFLMSISNFIK